MIFVVYLGILVVSVISCRDDGGILSINEQGFTIDGRLDDMEDEASYVDKCIWIEGPDEPTMVTHGGTEVKTSLIGTVIEDMKIHNCGYVLLLTLLPVAVHDCSFRRCTFYVFVSPLLAA